MLPFGIACTCYQGFFVSAPPSHAESVCSCEESCNAMISPEPGIWSSMSHEPAEPALPPSSVSAAPAVGSWLQTACTHGQMHGSPGPTWLVAIQTAAVPALSGCATGWPAVTALGLRYAGWSCQTLAAGDAACSSNTGTNSNLSSLGRVMNRKRLKCSLGAHSKKHEPHQAERTC